MNHLTVAQNIFIGREPRGRLGVLLDEDRQTIRATVLSFVKLLGIRTPSLTQEVRLLSGGNQQKVIVAKWLCRDCDILFFDEPTRGIDVGAKTEIHKPLRSLAD
jgi:ribose transport system ATP-binding protein